MPKETEQQYTAWLLYCEVGSIPKLIRAWKQMRRGIGDASGIWNDRIGNLGTLPAERNIEKWSSGYRWVERRDLKLKEGLEGLYEKTKRIKAERSHRIAEYFDKTIAVALKQTRDGTEIRPGDVKIIWEMFRTEFGETLGKHTHALGIDESKQTPPNEKEKILGEMLNNTVKQFYEREGGDE